jgi:CDP-2,3-bis-(O-geranylgeranyl)-sn-glycerol synthase
MADIGDFLAVIGIAFWVYVPALLPNTFAPFVGGGTPVDFGKSIGGRRILGDGKTWRGFIGGALIGGLLIGLAQWGLADLCGSADHWGYGTDIWRAVKIFLVLGFGSLIGDMMGSFLKRRIGIERGAKAPILDQYDFVFGSFLFLIIFDWQFFYDTYIEGIHIAGLIFLLLIIWFLHRGTNIIGYKIGVKNEPW